MPKYPINITLAAERDLNDIVGYLAHDNPAATLQLVDQIQESILPLEDFPLRGVIPKNRRLAQRGYRMLIIQNYLVFYVMLDNEILEIRRIISDNRVYQFLL